MRLLISLLLCPAILGQIQQKSKDPNDEPFLPIFPVYPYSPKLMKRGVDRETESRLTAELYGPKLEARDSYGSSYSGNYPRDPYYPSYDPYSKSSHSSPSTTASPSSSYTSYYPTNHATSGSYSTLSPYNLYDTYASPYTSSSMRSSMTSNPYTPPSYGSPSYLSTSYSTIYPPNPYNGAPFSAPPYVPVSNYYYQHPYYYPAYYSPPLYPPPPPVPLPPSDYNKDTDSDSKENEEKDSNKGQKSKDDDKSSELVNDNQFVDGGNYISQHTRDLESQSSSYKLDNPYNNPSESSSDSRQQSPLSQGTYKLVNAEGQRTDADYSIAATYAKTQQLEQLMRQTLAKLLAQNTVRQIVRYPTYESKQSPVIKSNDVFYANPNNYEGKQTFIVAPNTIAKTGLRYLIDPTGLTNVANVNSGSLLSRQVLQTPAALTRTTKYPDDQYLRKPVTRVNLQQSQGLYVTPSKTVKLPVTSQSTSGYEVYDESESSQANQSYGDSLDNTEGKQDQGYENDQDQTGYKSQNFVTAQTPQVYSYRYSSLRPRQTSSEPDSQVYEENPSDVEFGAKQSNKS